MVAASYDYPLGGVFLTMLYFFCWIIWFWLLISIFSDLFRRHDIGGWGKAGWFILVLFVPFLGVLIYLIACGKGMAERRSKDVAQAQQQMDDYVRSVAADSSSPTEEIRKGKELLDSGAISQAEFDALKQKALSAS